MRVLFATGSAPAYMAPPKLGDVQVNCGPDWKDERLPDGRWSSLQTPVGEYNLATVAAKLGVAQKPDLVVCLVDSSWRNLPKGLSAFKCPRVLLVADTHHQQSPILGMLKYMTSEPYTRIVLLYDRHHAIFFHSAGVKNLYWFPGLTFPHDDEVVRRARQSKRAEQIAFVGQLGRFHPRRTRLVEQLRGMNLPLVHKSVPQAEALAHYGASSVGLNVSLNGDLNLRVFEILASGAALLTDRLAPAAGLDDILTASQQYLSYGDINELRSQTELVLQDPAATASIAQAGSRWFDEHLNEKRRRAAFQALAINGTPHPAFDLSSQWKKAIFAGATNQLLKAGIAYERLQELHRLQERVYVTIAETVTPDIPALLSTLPRISFGTDAQGTCDLVVGQNTDEKNQPLTTRVWLPSTENNPPAGENILIAKQGFALVDPRLPLYRTPRKQSAAEIKHILVYTDDPETGGVAQYNHTILIALREAGYRVTSVQSRASNPLIREQQAAGVNHRWIEYDTSREFARTLTDGRTAEEIFCEEAPDLIYFCDCCSLSNLGARDMAIRLSIPFVVIVHFVAPYLAERFAPYLPALATQFSKAKNVIAVSQNNLDLLRSRFGLPENSGQVVYNGRPEVFFEPRSEPKRRNLRGQLGIPDSAFVCFTSARLTAVKGFQHQVAAMKALQNEPAARQIHFIWAGDGELRAKLQSQVASIGWSSRVHFLGHRWDVADWYDAADVFVLPSHFEGMPLSVMEAMAKGVPVIAAAVSGIPEQIADTGQLLPDPSAEPDCASRELARTLRRWSIDSQLPEALGAKARERAKQLFREERMRKETLAILSSALSTANSSGTIQARGDIAPAQFHLLQ